MPDGSNRRGGAGYTPEPDAWLSVPVTSANCRGHPPERRTALEASHRVRPPGGPAREVGWHPRAYGLLYAPTVPQSVVIGADLRHIQFRHDLLDTPGEATGKPCGCFEARPQSGEIVATPWLKSNQEKTHRWDSNRQPAVCKMAGNRSG